MKKLIFSCLALMAINSLYAVEEVAPDIEQKSPAKVEKSGFNCKLFGLRFALSFDVKDENKNAKKYLIGASLFGFLDDNTNMIGLYFDPYWRTAKNCSMTGVSFASANTFKNFNGISTNLIGGINKQTNGIVISGVMNKSEQTNGIAISGVINVTNIINGVCFTTMMNGGSQVNGISFAGMGDSSSQVNGIVLSGLINGAYSPENEKEQKENGKTIDGLELNGIAFAGLVNAYKDVNGVVIGGLGNKIDNMTGIECGLFNFSDNMTGYQLGLSNKSKKTDTTLQAAFANVSNKANDTGQFGFWNIIRGEDSSDTMQFGLINQSDTDSFQLGLLNFSEKGFFKFFPFINF